MQYPLPILGRALTRALFVAAALVSAVGCSTVSKVERVATTVQAREFNSVANAYLVRPTVIEVADLSDGTRVLQLGMDRYGGQRVYLMFPRGSGAEASALIDKFSEWAALATTRGETITKEIGQTRAWSIAGAGIRVKFGMHSGSPSAHYLVATSCSAAVCLDAASLYFDRAGADELRRALLAFDAGTLKASDSSVYR